MNMQTRLWVSLCFKIFIEHNSSEPKVEKRVFWHILGDTYLNGRRLFILSFSIVCVAIMVVGLLYWYSERLAEQKLQDYIKRLEDLGFTTEEHSLEDFHVDGVVGIHFFGDFHSFAHQEGIGRIYFDREIHGLYFLNSVGDRVEANVFYYK